MKKTFSKRSWITLISAPIVGTGIVLACAGGDYGPDDYGNSAFTPNAFVDSNSRPFFYTDLYKYYAIGYDQSHDERFNYANIDEWSAYLGSGVPRAELMYLLQQAPATTIDSIATWSSGKIKTLPQSVQSYKVLNKKNAPFINYLQLAKQAEAYAVNNLEYQWDYESKQNKAENINIDFYAKAFLQGFNTTKDAFLKQRYWFQATRAYFFNKAYQPAIDLFEKNHSQFPKNLMYYRTMAYAAGAYFKLQNFSKANYYYSRVYDGCPDLKTVAHYSFKPQEETDWKASLALCANNDEKATLWQMLGISYADEKRSIQEIYALNPRSEKLNLLLSRAINKEESRFTAWDYYQLDSGREPLPKDSGASTELLSIVSRIAAANNTQQPFMWQIAAGYLNMLNGDAKNAATWYATAQKTVPKEQLAQDQLRLFKLLNTIGSTKTVDSKLENTILKDLDWLRNEAKGAPGEFRCSGPYAWILRTLSNRYKGKKDYLKAVCFNNYSAFYADDKNVEAMKAFLDKTNKTSYEQLCASLYSLKKTDLVEYQGIRLALTDKLTEALAKLESGGITDITMPGNPFNGRIQDCHDCDHQAPQKIKYTRLSLLKKMIEMQDKVKAGEEVYSNALLLANAHYNITHYGNGRAFYFCGVMGSDHYAPFAMDSVFIQPLTSMTAATKYYTTALNAAKTDEQKARCQFMLAKCERNQWYNETVYNSMDNIYGSNPQGDFKAWNGFKVLLTQYANTQYYKEVIRECGYFQTYVGKTKRPG